MIRVWLYVSLINPEIEHHFSGYACHRYVAYTFHIKAKTNDADLDDLG